MDDSDYDLVMAAGSWSIKKDPHTTYAQRTVYKTDGTWTTQKLHRFILGVTDPKVEVDHAPDHDGLNCQRHNMRLATKAQNMCNQRLRNQNTSGFKGVFWDKRDKKWTACIGFQGKNLSLGCFDNPTDAALAYDVAALKYFGEFALTNAMLGLLPTVVVSAQQAIAV